ncbi:hypothetical protein H6503_04395 [Candidatus Woesearchaeota archaeon]|nr:hypothetical protein [Candidatus Woesearchaeota archaeon]
MKHEETNPIYNGDPEDFVWVGFGSGKGSNLEQCTKKVSEPSLIYCNSPRAELLRSTALENINKVVMDSYVYCGSFKKAQNDPELLEQYKKRSLEFDEMIVDALHNWENIIEKPIDLIVLGGYMKFVGRPILDAYNDKIINVHPSPLDVLEMGNRKYVGDNAIELVVHDRLVRTLSSVIMVDEGVDHGEILIQGPSLEVPYSLREGKERNMDEAIKKFQNKQKMISDWEAITTALEYIRDGRISIGTNKNFMNEWRTIYLDGEPLPYEGLRLQK